MMTPEPTVTIPKTQYLYLLSSARRLEALEDADLQGWAGYDEFVSQLDEEDDD